MTSARERGRIDRISPADAVELATDTGPGSRAVGAALLLEHPDPARLAAVLGQRLGAVPRFHQRLRAAPPGCGRPYWVPCPPETVAAAVRLEAIHAADDQALAGAAARELSRPLDGGGPLWRATVLVHRGAAVAVVLAMHHVLADGVGGLAVLAGVADHPAPGGPADPPGRAPTGGPTSRELLLDAWHERLRALTRPAAGWRRLRDGVRELGGPPRRAPRTALNVPTGSARAAHLAEVDLGALRARTRPLGATVNDALLVAVAEAAGAVLRSTGEDPAELVVSVPVSSRRSTAGADLGNAVGVMPVRVPLRGPLADRVRKVSRTTRARLGARGTSTAVLGPAFRALARLGVLHWWLDRQRLVNTFLTNLPGPPNVALAGAPVRRIVPIGVLAGNVGVAFAALSYAGRLGVTVVTDPAAVPDGAALATHLNGTLARLAGG
ncbi:wax ester/triacylglycerol synthase family O-acyltransferase [Isoptericola sp. b490]|uniref:wax ester/triacylglycerol synthase domain-containing protein n=1 Tax=Actinotalea lenta TaxID=3064654 RepID=UPI0027124275|nr:wax ester/triacylglycerol synthase domain-containing protein [Isoptericola sp. b490]MDO8121294.1 wax ester/triacylglycerol synthase family O-acyltransferase [Isoptericola sp. b490]